MKIPDPGILHLKRDQGFYLFLKAKCSLYLQDLGLLFNTGVSPDLESRVLAVLTFLIENLLSPGNKCLAPNSVSSNSRSLVFLHFAIIKRGKQNANYVRDLDSEGLS